MKIVESDFKDYYDYCAVQTKDERPIYRRKIETVVVSDNGSPRSLEICRILKPYVNIFKSMPRSLIFGGRGNSDGGLLGFCGKLYPHWKTRFDLGSVLEMVKGQALDQKWRDSEFAWNKKAKERFDTAAPTKIGQVWTHYDFTKADLEQFFKQFKPDIGDGPFIEIQAPIFNIYCRNYHVEIAVNPCLKDIGFQAVMKPFTAYQELDMYLGNNLATQVDQQPRPITDQLKAEAHGFNKWSFKTHKEDSAKAKKKRSKAAMAEEKRKSEEISEEVRKLFSGDDDAKRSK